MSHKANSASFNKASAGLKEPVPQCYKQKWFLNIFLPHIMMPLFNFKTRVVLIPFDKHTHPTHILGNNILSLFSVISTIMCISQSSIAWMPAKTNKPWVGPKQPLAGAETTGKSQTPVNTHTLVMHTLSQNQEKMWGHYVSSAKITSTLNKNNWHKNYGCYFQVKQVNFGV